MGSVRHNMGNLAKPSAAQGSPVRQGGPPESWGERTGFAWRQHKKKVSAILKKKKKKNQNTILRKEEEGRRAERNIVTPATNTAFKHSEDAGQEEEVVEKSEGPWDVS